MSVFAKICGIRSRDDLERICALGPDAVGFVFWPKSPRHVAPERVGEWETPAGVRRVGVFVNPSDTELIEAVDRARLDVAQLHRVDSGRRFDAAFPVKPAFWAALNADELASPVRAPGFAFPVETLLIDAYDPQSVGGTGKTCDWKLAGELVRASKRPVLLAGGLRPENVRRAVEAVRPWGVDVSSGVEAEPGRKDIAKVAAFLAALREG